MITHQLPIGTQGHLEIRDYTDRPTGKYVELWAQINMVLAIQPSLPWWTVVDGVQSPLSSWQFPRNTAMTRVSRINVADTAALLTWHIEDTGRVETGGPYDFTVTLLSGLAQAKAYVKVGNQWKRAIPFVKVAGVWRTAVPEGMINSEWKPAT